jgi:hypothetical protein
MEVAAIMVLHHTRLRNTFPIRHTIKHNARASLG